MLKAIVSLGLVLSISLPAFADKVASSDIFAAIEKDIVGKAALELGKGCQRSVRFGGEFQMFEATIHCSDGGDEETGGGTYLLIKIRGLYYGDKAGEVQNVDIMRAG